MLLQIKEEIRDELVNHILPFWLGLIDEENGGFYGYMDKDLLLDKKADKGCILNSRILWTFSNAYIALNDAALLDAARHSFNFLKDNFYDNKLGGVYWSVDYKGQPKDTIKHSYNIAFAIYGLSSYYEASGDETALKLAKEFMELLENVYRDEYGYKEALTVDFKPQSNEHLSENGVMAQKTMNTMLHIYEAYTQLYKVSKSEKAKEAMIFILNSFKDKIYNPKLHRLEVFFDDKMNTLIDLHSFGHDIEAAWLLERGNEILGDEALRSQMSPMYEDLEQEIFKVAFDGESLAAESENGKVLSTRIWWVQCEAIIGFYNAYSKRPSEKRYLEAAENIWNYVKEYMVDSRTGGEWFNERFYDSDRSINRSEPILSVWKCPYHNSRMCLEMMKRIPDEFDHIPVDKNATNQAKKMLSELANSAGKKLICGQHVQTNPMEERSYIKEVTGRYPKLVEFEMLAYSRNINYKNSSLPCLKEVEENKGMVKTALKLAKESEIIPVFCFHWFSPLGGSDKSFYSEHTDFDPEWVFEDGSDAQKAFYGDLDVIADELKAFYDEDIAVIFRPLHEVEGTWFWWGRKGGTVAAKLYRMIFDYFTIEKSLHNILWAWSAPTKESYPGDDFVDIVGWDIYLPEKKATDYAKQYYILRNNTTYRKVAAITEVGYNPDIKEWEKSKIPWAYYMTWSKEFALDGKINTKKELKGMYDSDYTITLA